MEYSFPCDCGQPISVAASAAGTEVTCPCGRRMPVPPLSDLRQRAGQGAYEAGIVDTIREMLLKGDLPWGDSCTRCGRLADTVVDLYVQCERRWYRGPSARAQWISLLLILLIPFYVIRMVLGYTYFEEKREELGRDTVVRTPVRLCCECLRHCQGMWSQRKLRNVLRSVPVYRELLKEYRWAKVILPS